LAVLAELMVLVVAVEDMVVGLVVLAALAELEQFALCGLVLPAAFHQRVQAHLNI
jgi:hypothetical protein